MLDQTALDTLFLQARSHNRWTAAPVSDDLLHRLYELTRQGPTSLNACPARFVFVRSTQAKQRLAKALSPGNLEKTLQAPVTVIVGQDLNFPDHLPRLFPHNPAVRSMFDGPERQALVQATALRNSSLQGAYLMLAARALGLDCGPMSGFDASVVDAEFFAGTSVRSNFLCNLGVGDPAGLFERSPRLEFDEVCQLA
jgi:3-hydroxypropanoate dehydrogenase